MMNILSRGGDKPKKLGWLTAGEVNGTVLWESMQGDKAEMGGYYLRESEVRRLPNDILAF